MRPLQPEPKMRYGLLVCLLFLLASCVAQPPERAVERNEVQELPASDLQSASTEPRAYENPKELMQAIGMKIRRNLVLPPGHFPASTRVTVKVAMTNEGQIRRLAVVQSSGYLTIDQSIQQAVMRSEPFPVLASYKEANKPLEFQIVFLPFAR